MGIEPMSERWQRAVIPLYYIRKTGAPARVSPHQGIGDTDWIRTSVRRVATSDLSSRPPHHHVTPIV